MEFQYKALNAENIVVASTVTAENQRAALRTLKKQGLKVINIDQAVTAATKTTLPVFGAAKPSTRDLSILLQQLCVLLQSGVSLDEAVDSLTETVENPILSQQCEKIGAGLRRGESFSTVLEKSGIAIPSYFFSLTEAGEMTGRLGQALRDGLNQWEYEQETRKKLVTSLTYPAILVMTGIVSVSLIFVMVVPKFVKILDKPNAEIPLLARLVLQSGKFVNENMTLIGIGAALFAGLMVLCLNNKEFRQKGWDFLGQLPLLKDWMREADVARWSSMLATLLENRVELLYALELAQRNVTLTPLKAGFSHIIKSVRGGSGLAQALRDNKTISATGHNLIRVGEKAGQLPAMLRSLALLSDESVKNRMQRFLLLIEPAAIIIIGGVVGTIMAGIILAITSMNDMAL